MATAKSIKLHRVCETCGDSFYRLPWEITKGRGRFCSRDCQRQWQTIPFEVRFQKYIGPTTSTGCIIWTGPKHDFGYGVIHTGTGNGKNVFAHRVSYERKFGPIAEGMIILHTCDNPPCINPDHMLVGTHQDNMRDKVSKGRQIRGVNIPWSTLNDDIVRDIRARRAQGYTYKQIRDDLGLSCTTDHVGKVIRGEIWSHVS